MHAKDDPRLIRFRDGFWFSRALLRREVDELERIRAKLRPDARDDLLHTVATVWQIVDAVRRVRDLAQATPGVSQRDAAVRTFLGATTIAEQFRHYVQHLRGELAKPEVDRFPVWGSISWVSAQDVQRRSDRRGDPDLLRPRARRHRGDAARTATARQRRLLRLRCAHEAVVAAPEDDDKADVQRVQGA